MNLTYTQRLYGAFLLLCGVLLSCVALAWLMNQTAREQFAKGRQATLETAALADAQSAIWALRWGVAQYVAVTDPKAREKIVADGPGFRKQVDEALNLYSALILQGEERQLLATLKESFQKYADSRSRWMVLMGEGKPEEAAQERASTTTPMGAATVKAFAELIRVQRSHSAETAQAATASLDRWSLAAAVVMGLGMLGSVLVASFAVRRMRNDLRHAVVVARKVCDGDLGQRITGNDRDEIGRLFQALDEMNRHLSRVVGTVRAGSQAIAESCASLAAGSGDLSQRTESQAANLQETAASMEQLSGTVRQSADTARQANEIASSASQAATKGGAVVSQVVATMDDISSASGKISDIIGVIDGIAFQTNILALNAAVEAARAGEQGRGFAVVAGEVRTLAMRSADAAREIKGLIQASVERVDAGARLVSEAGRTMTDIVERVQCVATLIDGISSAAGEQTTGIAQVSQAVTELDHTTQQNAALVEKAASAAAEVHNRAEELRNVVAVFRLAEA